jgi:elongation factor P
VIDTQDFKKGTWIELDGKPYAVVEVNKHAPTARGGKTLVKCKLRNLLDQSQLAKEFKSGEMFNQPDLRRRPVTFLYKAGENYAFMDIESYDQFELPVEKLNGQEGYLLDGLEVKAIYYNDAMVSIEVPQYVEMEVVSVEPGARGDTSGKVTTPATMPTGLVIAVPLYIKPGERIRINTVTGEFQDRIR